MSYLEEYQGMALEDKAKMQEEMTVAEESKSQNKAVTYMLELENRNREMLKAGNMHMPNFYNEVQRKALQRVAEKGVKEQMMNLEKKIMRERTINRRVDIWIGYVNIVFYTVAGTCVNLFVPLICAYSLSCSELVGMIFLMITMYVSGGLISTYPNVKSFGLVNAKAYMIFGDALLVYNMIVARKIFANSILNELIEFVGGLL